MNTITLFLSLLLCLVSNINIIYGGIDFAQCLTMCDDTPCTDDEEDCTNDVCSEDDSPFCTQYDVNYGGGCLGCQDLKFYLGPTTQCVSCEDYAGCTDCDDYKGCITCDLGGELTWSESCGFIFCQGDTITETDTTTETDDEDDDDDDDEDDDDDDDDDVTTDEYIETAGAYASFSNDGIDGTVKVINGHIIVDLDFSGFDFTLISDFDGEECVTSGLFYGIFDEWNHDDSDSLYGSDDCSVDYTGERWDPWLACSEHSNNEYCENNDIDNGYSCVPPSSWQWNPDDNGYVCSQYLYIYNPFACEVGDLSGKYGQLEYNSENQTIYAHVASPWEIDSYDLSGKSIVFRCGNDYSRAFCSPFEEYVPSEEDEIDGTIESLLSRPYQNLTYSQIAYLDDDKESYILLTYYQIFDIHIDVSSLVIPGGCGDSIYYRIFTDYLDDTCDIDDLNYYYDPTLTCNENSENVDKGYCDETQLCWDNDYIYECESNTYYYNRFKCGPGDLSNKYGSIDISSTTSFTFDLEGYDPLMIPLINLEGKSIVLQCESDDEVIACGKFIDYTNDTGVGNAIYPDYWDDIAAAREDSSSDDDDTDSLADKAANDDNFLGVSNEVAIIMLILVGLSIFPCIRGCRNRSNASKESTQAVAQHGRGASGGGAGGSHRRTPSAHSSAKSTTGVSGPAEDIMKTIQNFKNKYKGNKNGSGNGGRDNVGNYDRNDQSQSGRSQSGYSPYDNGPKRYPTTVPAMQNDIGWM